MVGRDARLVFQTIASGTVANADQLAFKDMTDGQWYYDNLNDCVSAAMAAGVSDAVISNTCNFTGAVLTFTTDQIARAAYPTMGAASAGSAGQKGAVPAAAAGQQAYILLGNATWGDHGDINGLSDDDHPQYHKDNDALVAASASCTYLVVTPGADQIGIKITTASSPSVSAFRLEDNSNNPWVEVTSTGSFVLTPPAGSIGIKIHAASSPSASLIKVEDNSSNQLVDVDAGGDMTLNKWLMMPSQYVAVVGTAITPTSSAVYITGTTNTIDTINNAEDGKWLLIRNTGSGTLTLATGGNILFGKTVTTGRLVMLYYYGPASKWIDYS